jgi:hypothetical protein
MLSKKWNINCGSWINISNNYKKNFKSPKILTAWARNVGLALCVQKKT